MISELLRSQDHVVSAFSSGLEAHQSLANNDFDLMILDWELPQMTGIDVLKKYRAVGGTTPVLMLTGKKKLSDKESGLDAGADDYLTKPFHPQELTARIRALLRRAQIIPKPPTSDLEVGATFAERYEVLELLGRGSSGAIYKARHVYLDRIVALKVLHPHLTTDEEAVERFKREAQALSQLDHRNIVKVHDFGVTAQKLSYLVLDYCPGETLSRRTDLRDHISVSEAIPIFIQVCDGLAHAHERGIIHRDVKPSNLLIVDDQRGGILVKLADFGIAKLLTSKNAAEITQDGDVIGSPSFMSPEQCMGRELDFRTDVYSMGCVMYSSLLGQDVFAGDNVLDTMYKRTVEDPKTFAEARPDLSFPPGLESIVMKALARERNDRYQTILAVKQALERLQIRDET